MGTQEVMASAKEKFNRFMKRLLILVVILLVLVIGLSFVAFNVSFSSGERAGTVSKFSHRGYVFKTYEGDLNVGGFSGNTGNLTPQIWSFSVDGDAEVAKKLEDAMLSGKRVRLHYEQKYFKLFWKGESEYFVTEIAEAP